ncbi:MAG TPA: hypothetical protein VFY28_00640 [Candidatus Paceibacterota bacterium]|nr:hypothetical protein [Candidatus Paceibacterota bacterium]
MKVIRIILPFAALLLGSAAPAETGDGAIKQVISIEYVPPEPERYVRQSLRRFYEDPLQNFRIEDGFIPLSQVEAYVEDRQDLETYIDVCEFTKPEPLHVILTKCDRY